MPSPTCTRGDQLSAVLAAQQESICAIMSEWMTQHKKMYEEHMGEQQRLIAALQGAHQDTLRHMSNLVITTDFASTTPIPPVGDEREKYSLGITEGFASTELLPQVSDQQEEGGGEEVRTDSADTRVGAAKRNSQIPPEDLPKVVSCRMNNADSDEQVLNVWRRSSGMHTVDKWVKNHHKHPAGWAALLTIHGIPEMTSRLRSKVDNYAIYSALFLSMSMPSLMSPPDTLVGDLPDRDWWDWTFSVPLRCRLYAHLLMIGNAFHMLSIMLSMSFNDALNEAARDSDVFRMFARGQGFLSTVKCQQAFRYGCVADFVAVMIAASCYSSAAEMIVVAIVLAAYCGRQWATTTHLLMSNVSIVKYWREELGGKPDKDDPYDLSTPMSCFDERCETNRELFKEDGGAFCGNTEEIQELWRGLRERADVNPMAVPPLSTTEGGGNLQNGVVAALF